MRFKNDNKDDDKTQHYYYYYFKLTSPYSLHIYLLPTKSFTKFIHFLILNT